MKELFANLLHVFIIFMLAIFVTGCIMAATGVFDHWADRYRLKRRRRRLLKSNTKPGNGNIFYYSTNPDKNTKTTCNNDE